MTTPATEQIKRNAPVIASGNGHGKKGKQPCDVCGHHAKLHRVTIIGEPGVELSVCDECDGEGNVLRFRPE